MTHAVPDNFRAKKPPQLVWTRRMERTVEQVLEKQQLVRWDTTSPALAKLLVSLARRVNTQTGPRETPLAVIARLASMRPRLGRLFAPIVAMVSFKQRRVRLRA